MTWRNVTLVLLIIAGASFSFALGAVSERRAIHRGQQAYTVEDCVFDRCDSFCDEHVPGECERFDACRHACHVLFPR